MMGTLEERDFPLRRCRSPTRASAAVARRRLQNAVSENIYNSLETTSVATQNEDPIHLYGLDKNEDYVLGDKKVLQQRSNEPKSEDNDIVGGMMQNVLRLLLQSKCLKAIVFLVFIGICYKVVLWLVAKDYDEQNDEVLSKIQFKFKQFEMKSMEELDKKVAALGLNCTSDEAFIKYRNTQKQAIEKLQQQIVSTVNVVKSLSEKLNLLQKTLEDEHKKFEDEQKMKKNGLCQGDDCKYSSQNIYAVAQSFLELYSADVLGIPDFALESAGGSIHMPHHSETCDSGSPIIKVFGLPLWHDPRSPRTIITTENLPGTCWPMKGNQGYVVIKLASVIKPTMVSLEHLDQRLDQYSLKSYKSAPKQFEVFAWFNGLGTSISKIGSFTYLRNSSAIQSFKLEKEVNNVMYIELRILSNYGNEDCTCIYRFRVHGISNDWMSGNL